MIDILAVSSDPERLDEVVRLIGECGMYRTKSMVSTVAALPDREGGFGAFDVLIVDLLTVTHADLATMAKLSREYEQLICILVTPASSSDTVIAAMRAGIRDVLSWPLDRQAMAEALSRVQSQRVQSPQTQVEMLSFMSCKGGAGTTFIATNVAYLLATKQKKRVLLIDLNQQFSDAAFVVSAVTPSATLPQICQQIGRVDAAFLESSLVHVAPGFDILAGAGDPIRAAEISTEGLEWIFDLVSPRYDMIVFDIGQTLNHLSIVALDRSEAIYVVLQTTMPYLRAGRRLQEILGSLGYPPDRIRLILNRYSRHDELSMSALQEVLGMEPYQTIPSDGMVVLSAINQGVPVASSARKSAAARSLSALAERLARGEESKKKGGSLFGFLKGRQATSKMELT